MHYFDWSLVALYFLLSLAIGLYYTKRAGSGTKEFFLSGRNLPWWLAGTSMVATTFAADTPLAVTELVAKNGIAGNWLWWNFVFGGMLTVFFFARLWRRAGIMTDVEFVEIRYSGKPAAFLRGFRALYLGLFINCVIIGWVNVAMGSILQGLFGIPESQVILYVAGAMIIVAIYSALSGLWGVAVTDVFQFIIAMVGTTIL
ncbi:MAG: sodium:proline symporter, partial [Bacteroidetes bacterium]|nr:sodium:proline symporter [Bacteroidota bacterium]